MTTQHPLWIISERTILKLSKDSFLVEQKLNNGKLKRHFVPSENISYIVKEGRTLISEAVLDFCADKGITIFRFSYGGKPTGCFLPLFHNVGKTHLKQYEFYFNEEKKLQKTKTIIEEASKNKLSLLKKYYSRNKKEEINKQIFFIGELINSIQKQLSIESLRGIEGRIAHHYWIGFSYGVKYFTFTSREYNPPKGEINALLSYIYSHLYSEIYHKLHEHGLSPFIAMLHEQNNSQLPLVYDLSEKWKQVCDQLILEMINTKEFSEQHFSKKKDGACLLNTYGKNIFLRRWNSFLCSEFENEKSFSETIRQDVIQFKKEIGAL